MMIIERVGSVQNMNTRIRQPPTDENRKEALTLHALWRSNRDRLKEIGVYTQADIGARYGIGHQSTVAAYLTGKAAMGLKAAQGFALAFNCKVSDFSPRLAGELEAIRAAAARTEGTSTHEISAAGRALAKAFDAIPGATDEEVGKKEWIFAMLHRMIAAELRLPSAPRTPAPSSPPIAAPALDKSTQPLELRKP